MAEYKRKWINIPAAKIGMNETFDLALNLHYKNDLVIARNGTMFTAYHISGGEIDRVTYKAVYAYYDTNNNCTLLLFDGTNYWELTSTAIVTDLAVAPTYGMPLATTPQFVQILTNLYVYDGVTLNIYHRTAYPAPGTHGIVNAREGCYTSGFHYFSAMPRAKIVTKFGNSVLMANFDPNFLIPTSTIIDKDTDEIDHKSLTGYDAVNQGYWSVSLNECMFMWSEPLGLIGGLIDPNGLAFSPSYVQRINSNEPITAITEYQNSTIFVFTEHEIHIAKVGGGDSSLGTTYSINMGIMSREVGCLAQGSVQEVNGKIIFLGNDGFYSIGNDGFEKISPRGINRIFTQEQTNITQDVFEYFRYSYVTDCSLSTFNFNPTANRDRIKSTVNLRDKEYICQIPIMGSGEMQTAWIVYNYETGNWYIWTSVPRVETPYVGEAVAYLPDLESANIVWEKISNRIFFPFHQAGLCLLENHRTYPNKQIPILLQSRELFADQESSVLLDEMKIHHMAAWVNNDLFDPYYFNAIIMAEQIAKETAMLPKSFIDSEGGYQEYDTYQKSNRVNVQDIPLCLNDQMRYFWGAGQWGGTVWKGKDLITHSMNHGKEGKWHRIGLIAPIGRNLEIHGIEVVTKVVTEAGELNENNG